MSLKRFFFSKLWLVSWVMLSGGLMQAAEPEKLPWPNFSAAEPLPGVLERAKREGIDLRAVAAPDAAAAFVTGDTVTFLATLVSGKKRTQWIVELRTQEPTEKEKLVEKKDRVTFTSTGRRFGRSNARTPVSIAVVGPFKGDDGESVKVRRKRVLVEEESLHSGLTGLPTLMAKVNAVKQVRPAGEPKKEFNFNTASKPFPEDVVARNRAAAEELALTEDDERSLAGTVPALMEFFMLIGSTPGLDEMLKSVIDLPLWAIVKSAGKPDINLNLVPLDASAPGARPTLPLANEQYALGINLGLAKKSALLTRLAVIKPVAPYEASAGMVGLVAGAPDGKGPVLTLQLIASFTAAN